MTDCNLAARECHIHSFSRLLFALALRLESFFLGIESTDRRNRVERRIIFVIHLGTVKNKKNRPINLMILQIFIKMKNKFYLFVYLVLLTIGLTLERLIIFKFLNE